MNFEGVWYQFGDVLHIIGEVCYREVELCRLVSLTLSPPLVAPHAFSVTALLRLAPTSCLPFASSLHAQFVMFQPRGGLAGRSNTLPT
ncbi:MAG: hypothetical protein J1F13_00850 [Prevotellaceae bacterium]|nr:hypothetical protein [Prevotellaceae bacterium]